MRLFKHILFNKEGLDVAQHATIPFPKTSKSQLIYIHTYTIVRIVTLAVGISET